VRDHIFICYRHDDASSASGRLCDWLSIAFGSHRVFQDVHSIGIGDWQAKIDAALSRSVVFVAVIGPRWVDADNLPRLHEEADRVRYEVIRALGDRELRVVPTLVEGAAVPKTAALPAELQPLFAWNFRRISLEGWGSDVHRLVMEIAHVTGLAVNRDFDRLLSAQSSTQQRIAGLPLQADQVEAVLGTVDELTRKYAEASAVERPARAFAIDALASGDSLAAERLFEDEYHVQNTTATDARQRMADAARSVANLALLRDVTKAVLFYRKAFDAAPEDAETARLFGYALMLVGELAQAEVAMIRSMEASIAKWDPLGEMAAGIGLGDVHVANGHGPEALDVYHKSLAIAQILAARAPPDRISLYNLSVCYDRIADVLAAQGEGARALDAYRKCCAIVESEAARDPANTRWQRDLAVVLNKIGDVLVTRGDESGALSAYRNSLAVAHALETRDLANTDWQRILSVSYDRVGDVLLNRGDLAGSLHIYRKSLDIAEKLVTHDPGNMQWQSDLAVSHNKVGDVHAMHREWSEALDAYRRSRGIWESLVTRAPTNAAWRRDLSVSFSKIGFILLTNGDGPAALDAYQKAHEIIDALTTLDPTNIEWRRDFSVSLYHIGDVLVVLGDEQQALDAYRKSFAISDASARRDPGDTQAQIDLAVLCAKLGTIPDRQDVELRRQFLLRGRDILLKLKSTGKLLPNRDWVAWFEKMIDELD
jgi:tetratricopeptide (TPR) repeat protein